MVELPLGSSGSKKLATTECSFTKLVVFRSDKCSDAGLRNVSQSFLYTVSFYTSSFSKSKVTGNSSDTRVNTELLSGHLRK
jgi:hypothetical protein